MTGATGGKRAGSRRGPRRRRTFQPALLGLAVAITATLVAWGYLVVAAVEFGATARGGDAAAWRFLAIASVGAVACLFIAMMLVVRLLRRLGITQAPPPRRATTPDRAPVDTSAPSSDPSSPSSSDESGGGGPEPPRPIGGRRAAR